MGKKKFFGIKLIYNDSKEKQVIFDDDLLKTGYRTKISFTNLKNISFAVGYYPISHLSGKNWDEIWNSSSISSPY